MPSTEYLIDEYQREQQRRGLSPNTVAKRRYTYRLFAAFLHPRDLLQATRHDVDDWLDSRMVGARTRYWHVSNLACFYDWCVLEELLERNPVHHIARPRLRRLVPRPIASPDLARALTLADDRMRCWLLLAAYNGLRAAEIAALRREDLLLDNDPPLMLVNGKGGYQRLVPLNAHVQQALDEYGIPSRGYLWRGQRGPLQPKTVSRNVSRFFHGIGIKATAHRGRHWFGSAVYARTKDIRLVQELMGHASPLTTSIYAAFSPEEAAIAVRNLSVTPVTASGN